MKKTLIVAALAIMASYVLLAAEKPAKTATVTGFVIDSACAYTKNLDKPISTNCATACAKKGSPLVILTEEGTIYLPIDHATPAMGQNEKLMPYAGKRVSVTGKVYEHSGARAMVIEKIEAAPAAAK